MKKIIDFTIEENRKLNEDLFRLTLRPDEELPEIRPGQFVNVRVDDSPSTFLRRPISVHDVETEKGRLYLLIKIAGTGTARLSSLASGEKLNIMLPLGNGFSIPLNQERCLLIGGGVGIAPMLHFSRELNKKNIRPTLLIGVRSRKDIALEKEFGEYADVYYTTEDGSYGEKGYPTGHSLLNNRFDRIFCCGPQPMMQAVARYARKNDIECEVSLENTMACGIGACLCCVTETSEGHKCVCTEGPVMNIKDLKWQI